MQYIPPTTQKKPLDRRFSVAPMLHCTDRHCRYFYRILSKHAMLYTEMVTTTEVLTHGHRTRCLQHDPFEYPLALQLGGDQPTALAQCARLAETLGFQEVNFNVGCPSNKVQSGRIGACLMAEPQTVAAGVKAMRDAVSIPITVKHRLGIDGRAAYPELVDFVGTVADAGCQTFIVHARIAVLTGLSPKENRVIPPLKPDWVYRLQQDFPHLTIILNGGVQSLTDVAWHRQRVPGVMMGRAVYHNPYFLAAIDSQLYGCHRTPISRHAAIEQLLPYIEAQLKQGVHLQRITRHLLPLYHGLPGGRYYRRHLSEQARQPNAGVAVLHDAVAQVAARCKTHYTRTQYSVSATDAGTQPSRRG